MKKLLFGVFCAFLAVCMLSIAGCRTRVASAPGPEPTVTLTATATMYLTPTITPTSAPISLTYDFEGGLNGWVRGGGTGFTAIADAPASSVPGGAVISGNYCLSATCSFLVATTDGEVVVNPVPSDLSSVSHITAHVYVPADMPAGYSVQVFVLTGTGYAFAGQNDASPTLGAWNTVTLNTSGIANMNNVDAIAVQILSNSGPAWSGTIYVDDVTVN